MSQKYEIQEFSTHQTKNHSHHQPINNESMDSQADHKNHFEELMIEYPQTTKNQKKIGNIKILYENQRFLFTIGPDYVCFCISYIMFTILNFVIVYTAATQIKNIYVNIANIIVSLVQNLSYLVVALSNPGIQTKNTLPTDDDSSDQIKRYSLKQRRFCKQCGIRMQKGTHHCRQCNVCIRNYDHHCPWTSKCIGEKNLSKFYVFLASTLFYIVYCLVMLIVCMVTNAIENEKNLQRTKTF